MSEAAEPRFVCDEMLGKLSRWLRFLGFDTEYVQRAADDDLLELATSGGRILVTRDVALAWRASRTGRSFLVRSLDPAEQLREVVRALSIPIDPGRIFTRCTMCNGALAACGADEAALAVPPGVGTSVSKFWSCSRCGKIYWRGTHTQKIEARLEELRKDAALGRG